MAGTPRGGVYRSRFGPTDPDPDIFRVRRRMARAPNRPKVYQVAGDRDHRERHRRLRPRGL